MRRYHDNEYQYYLKSNFKITRFEEFSRESKYLIILYISQNCIILLYNYKTILRTLYNNF